MKKLHFKTHVHLKNIIGKDLINDDNVAIQELIKNSYDAGSKSVDVIFRNIKSNKDNDTNKDDKRKDFIKLSKILIVDAGEGMSEQDIIDKWLNIAYSSKKVEDTKFGRKMAGAKGVGRFSCDRLGEFLDIYTKTSKDKKINHLTLNWNDFEFNNDLNYEIQKVDIILNDPISEKNLLKQTGIKLHKSGTILEISKLRENWISQEGKRFNYDKIISLKAFLEKLTNPNQDIDNNQFKIYLKIDDLNLKDFNIETKWAKDYYSNLKEPLIKNKIFKNLSFKVTRIFSEISNDGKEIITRLLHRDELIFEIREKNRFNLLKNIKIDLYFLNQYSKAYFKRYTFIDSVRFGSIFLFVNGFRISPFGDFGNDWLGLELRKGQGRARYLGARDMIGRIEINNLSEKEFKIISNREGLAKNEYYKQLVGKDRDDLIHSYFYSIFRKLELFVVEGLDWDRIKESIDSDEDLEEESKSTVKKFMTAFNEKISSSQWKYDPSAESYQKTEREKKQLILDQLSKIIYVGTNKKDILSLYINENLILDLAEENIDKLNSLLSSIKNFEEEKFDTKTSKGIHKIKLALERLKEKAEKEAEKRKEAEKKQGEAEEKAKEESKKREKAEEKAEEETEKRKKSEKREIFIKSLLGKSTEEIVKLQHQIKIISGKIESSMLNLKELVESGNIPTKERLVNIISEMIVESQKIKKITEIVTSANFDMNSRKIHEDIIKFIVEYVSGFKNSLINTTIENGQINFSMLFSPLEIQIIIDNLYDNAKKNDATQMDIEFKKISNDKIKIKFMDTGKRVDKDNLEELFKFGFTTELGGSGLGLYNIRHILKEMNSEINFIQNDKEKGFEVILTR